LRESIYISRGEIEGRIYEKSKRQQTSGRQERERDGEHEDVER